MVHMFSCYFEFENIYTMSFFFFFFFNDTATTEIYTLSLHDALPISRIARGLFDALGLERAHWVGTSMGGAIGTVCASGLFEPSLRARIATLVLNDNAPQLAESALARIRSYAGQPPAFDTVGELEAFFRQAYRPYGWLSDSEWRKLTETSVRRLPDGRVDRK